MSNAISRLLILVFVLALAACGGSGSSTTVIPTVPAADVAAEDTTEEVTVSASLGLISGATVRILQPDGTEITGASGTLAADGTVTITHDGTYDGPIIVEVVGNDSATYFDESTGANQPFGADQVLRAVAPSIDAAVGVTILTDLAYQQAAALGGSLTADDVNAINESIRQMFAPDVEDILVPPVLVGLDNFTQGTLEDTDAGRYALRLAALANMAAGAENPALAILAQLRADLEDGDLDGQSATANISDLYYTANDFAASFATAVNLAAANLGNSDLVTAAANFGLNTALNILTELTESGVALPSEITDRINNVIDAISGDPAGICETLQPTGDGTFESATIPSHFTAEAFDLEFFAADSAAPNDDGDTATFLFSSSGKLSIDDVEVADDPILCNGFDSEAVWLDEENGIIYGASSLTGEFNEVNIASATTGTFLGQWFQPGEDGAPAALTNAAGTYNMVVRDDCVGGNQCPSTKANEDTVTLIIGEDGSMSFDGVELSPDVADATVTDNSTAISPRITLGNPGEVDGETLSITVYLEDSEAVGVDYQKTLQLSQGSVSQSLYAEVDAPDDHDAFFADFVAVTSEPVTLTVIADDSSYFGKLQSLTGSPSSAPTLLCRTFTVQGVTDTEASAGFIAQFAVESEETAVMSYDRRTSRLSVDDESGDQTLSFQGGQLVLAEDGTITLQEGFLTGPENFVAEADIKDVSTNDESLISTACADFYTVSGTIETLNSGTLFIELVDTSGETDVQLDTVSTVISDQQPTDFVFQGIADGTDYEIRQAGQSPSTLVCTVPAADTIDGADVTGADVSCSVPEE